jgi:hypothetical protein
MADSNSNKTINVSDSIDIKSTHQGRSNDTMEVEDEAELMMIDTSTVVSWLYHLSVCMYMYGVWDISVFTRAWQTDSFHQHLSL